AKDFLAGERIVRVHRTVKSGFDEQTACWHLRSNCAFGQEGDAIAPSLITITLNPLALGPIDYWAEVEIHFRCTGPQLSEGIGKCTYQPIEMLSLHEHAGTCRASLTRVIDDTVDDRRDRQ